VRRAKGCICRGFCLGGEEKCKSFQMCEEGRTGVTRYYL
jgi:hypothetical protein